MSQKGFGMVVYPPETQGTQCKSPHLGSIPHDQRLPPVRVGRGEHRSGHVCCVDDVYVGHADARLAAVDQWPAVAALTLLFPNWKGTLGYSESRLIYYRIASLIAKFACFNLVRKNH